MAAIALQSLRRGRSRCVLYNVPTYVTNYNIIWWRLHMVTWRKLFDKHTHTHTTIQIKINRDLPKGIFRWVGEEMRNSYFFKCNNVPTYLIIKYLRCKSIYFNTVFFNSNF